MSIYDNTKITSWCTFAFIS